MFNLLLKNDSIHYTIVSRSYRKKFGCVSKESPTRKKELSYKISAVLSRLFCYACLRLTDSKLEFDLPNFEAVMDDELSPGGSYLRGKTLNKIEKDRYRWYFSDLAKVCEEVTCRIGVKPD